MAGKTGMGGTITEAPKIEEGSPESEAKAELERRINVIFEGSEILRDCKPRFENFARHATADIFIVEVSIDDHTHDDRFLQRVLQGRYSVNNVVKIGSYKYRVAFDIKSFENRLVQNEELAGIYVDQAPLTVDQITKPRLHWANLKFDKVVQPHVNRTSTAFKSIEEADGELRIYAETAFRAGSDAVFRYVSENKPLGFHINWGDKVPADGFYLRISFADFKKLLPSTSVDEVMADVSGKVDGATG